MKRALVIASIAALGCTLTAVAALAADISGTWTMSVQTSAGAGSPTFVLAQQGTKVSGTYAGALGSAPVSGTVQGNNVRLTFKVSGGGQEAQVEYAGAVDGNKISGTVKIGTAANGTFTGTKK